MKINVTFRFLLPNHVVISITGRDLKNRIINYCISKYTWCSWKVLSNVSLPWNPVTGGFIDVVKIKTRASPKRRRDVVSHAEVDQVSLKDNTLSFDKIKWQRYCPLAAAFFRKRSNCGSEIQSFVVPHEIAKSFFQGEQKFKRKNNLSLFPRGLSR